MKVKVCGITNLRDAKIAIASGANALGFVFYKKSPRYIRPQEAKQIIKVLPRNILKVGIFVGASRDTVGRIAKLCRLDMLQFHGNESPGFCRKFGNYKIIKAFRVKDSIDFKNILRYKVSAYLFDAFLKSKIGGTGRKFDWALLKDRGKIDRPIFLSGGLNNKNVKEAIKNVHPDWVDISSGVEIKPGKKDYKKIKDFIKSAKNRG